MQPAQIITQNETRWRVMREMYDPTLGIGSPVPRVKVALNDYVEVAVPFDMAELDSVKFIRECGTLERSAKKLGISVNEALEEFTRIRCKYDFEFWSASCVEIQTKADGLKKFVLNRPQRKLLKEMESLRLQGAQIRIILLKSRQWGGSTLVQLYIAWIQLYHKTSWNAMVVAAKKDQALHIRGMYKTMASRHPAGYVEGIERVVMSPYEGTQNIRKIEGRNCIIGVGSVEEPDSIRSFTTHMLHLSEVGLWKSTTSVNAEEMIAGLEGGLFGGANTICVKESTAKGVGNYFHRAWQKAVKGESNDRPVFVAWFENADDYWNEIENKKAFVDSIWNPPAEHKERGEYEQTLWAAGATLEHIAWYREKAKAYHNDWQMQAEYPTTPEEAFQSTGSRIFPVKYVLNARATCKAPIAIGELLADAQKNAGALKNIRFEPSIGGKVLVWTHPNKLGLEKSGKNYTNRYAAFADVGGRSAKADYHSITILDRLMTLYGGTPYVCAEFHGHLDPDLFAWYSVRLARWYDNALLAIEINKRIKDSGDPERGYEGSHAYTILDEIKHHYGNLYYRVKPETVKDDWDGVIGFHTNVSTKPMLIDALNAAMRDEAYEERNQAACDEFDDYELKQNGTMGAVDGKHDDRVISRAGAVWLSGQMDPVREVDIEEKISTAKKGGFAQFA